MNIPPCSQISAPNYDRGLLGDVPIAAITAVGTPEQSPSNGYRLKALGTAASLSLAALTLAVYLKHHHAA